MNHVLDLDRHPIDRPDSREGALLLERCRHELLTEGMFNLEGFVRENALSQALREVFPRIENEGYRHARWHNIYFKKEIPGLAADHPALQEVQTVHRTLCADQLTGTIVDRIYQWTPMLTFLARAMGKPQLFLMDDPLARLNVIGYEPGQALNWHFDRSQYTTTLMIRAADAGGEFQYRSGLRSARDPNYDGVALLLRGRDPQVKVQSAPAGTLNVFAGRNTAHRVSAVRGDISRLIAVFSYYDQRDVTFSDAERFGFYGRRH